MKLIRILATLAVMLLVTSAYGANQSTAFTYQGHLLQNGTPTNGAHNLVFTLWDSASGGNQVGPTISQSGYPIANGVFDIDLDFGATAFNGQQRWLDVSVDGNELTPRQPVNASPVAVYALSAASGVSVTASISTNQFSNDHLYTGISVQSQSPTMVMIANPTFSPAGASLVSGYTGGVDVMSLTSEYSNTVTFGTGGGGGSGKAMMGDARVLARLDPAYAGLAASLFTGQHYSNLQIDVLGPPSGGAKPNVAQSFCYGLVFVKDLQPMPQDGIFEMSLAVGQAGVRIYQANPSGQVTMVQTGWDFTKNVSLPSAPCVN